MFIRKTVKEEFLYIHTLIATFKSQASARSTKLYRIVVMVAIVPAADIVVVLEVEK